MKQSSRHDGATRVRPAMRARAVLAAAGLAVTLTGCGLAETGVTAAAEAKANADAAQEGLKTEARVRAQLEQAQQAAAAQRQAVDAE